LIFARCPNNTILQKGCARGVDFEYLRYVCEMFWWFFITKVSNFYKKNYAKNIYRIKSRGKILKSSFEFEYFIKLVQLICAAVLLDRG
jgi:hypothetical protein